MADTSAGPHAPQHEAPPSGPLSHLERWISERYGADLADARIKAENAAADARKALAYAVAHEAAIERLAALAVKLAGVADPALGPVAAALVAEAEAILAEVSKRGEEFGQQM